jgi:hypothetical protein
VVLRFAWSLLVERRGHAKEGPSLGERVPAPGGGPSHYAQPLRCRTMRRVWWRKKEWRSSWDEPSATITALKRGWQWIGRHAVAVVAVLVVASIPIVTFLVWSLQSPEARNDWNWGTVPEWIAGMGTALAFGFAAIAFSHDLNARRDEDRKSQARLVDAWVAEAHWQPQTNEESYVLVVTVQASNGSSQTVRAVGVDVEFHHQRLFGGSLAPVIPPTQPGTEPTYVLNFSGFDSQYVSKIPDNRLRFYFGLSIDFVDAAGNRWIRTQDGALRWLYNVTDRAREAAKGS